MYKLFKGILLFHFLFVSLSAQIVITKNQMPVPDSLYAYNRAFPNNINYSNAGPNYIWDYSQLSELSSVMLSMADPIHTPFVYQVIFNNPLLPNNNSTHAEEGVEINLPSSFGFSLTDVYNFYKNSNSSFTLTGIGATINGIQTPIPYQIKDQVYSFPLEYGDIDTSSFLFAIEIPTIGYWKQYGTRINSVDGWGTLLLPGSQAYEVLRIKTSLTLRDTIHFESSGFTLPVTRKQFEYKFITLQSEFPALQINTQLLFLSTGPQVVQSVLYKKAPVSSSIYAEDNPLLQVWPNPVSDILYLNMSDDAMQYSLLDINGKELENGHLKEFIDVSQYPAGIYVLKISEKNGSVSTKRIIKQ